MIRVDRHILVPAVICMIFAGAGSARATGFSDGKTLYERNCAVCHGEDGSVSRYGKSLKPFPARNLRAVAQWLDTDEFRRIISYGLHNSKMTAKKYILNPLEIESVIRYIKTFKFSPNLNVGRKRYRQVCAICHGKDGKTRTGMDATQLEMHIRYGRHVHLAGKRVYELTGDDIQNITAYLREQESEK